MEGVNARKASNEATSPVIQEDTSVYRDGKH